MDIIPDVFFGYLIGISIKKLWLVNLLSVLTGIIWSAILVWLRYWGSNYSTEQIIDVLIVDVFVNVIITFIVMFLARKKTQKGWAA